MVLFFLAPTVSFVGLLIGVRVNILLYSVAGLAKLPYWKCSSTQDKNVVLMGYGEGHYLAAAWVVLCSGIHTRCLFDLWREPNICSLSLGPTGSHWFNFTGFCQVLWGHLKGWMTSWSPQGTTKSCQGTSPRRLALGESGVFKEAQKVRSSWFQLDFRLLVFRIISEVEN